MSATALLAREPGADRGRGAEGAAGQHLPLHRLLEHRRGGRRRVAGEDRGGGGGVSSTVREDVQAPQKGFMGVSTSAQGGPAARPGPGRLRRRRQAPRDGLRPVRPLAVRAREDPLGRRLEGARGARRVRDAHRRRGRDPHRPVLPDLVAARLEREGLRPRRREGALRRRARRGGRGRDARARARRRRARRDRVRAAAGRHRRAQRAGRRRAGRSTTRPAATSPGRASTTGATSRARSQGADHVVRIGELHFDRFNSTPLELDGAVVEYNRGIGQWTIQSNNQFPGFAIDHDGPGDAGRARQAPLRLAGHRRRVRQQDHARTRTSSRAASSRGSSAARSTGPSGAPTSTRTCRTGTSAGSWTSRSPVKADGTLLGFRAKALDDAGAFLRYEPLGGVIWSQVTPGCYRWRNIRLDFTQVMTNKAPVSPNRGYSRMQHLWFTERIIDIVAHELGLDPVEIRKRNYIKAEEMPYETPNGCVYDSGDYAKSLDIALDLIGYRDLEARRADAAARGKLLGFGIGSTLDSGTNNFGQSRLINPELQFSGNNEVASVKLDIFGEVVVHARDGAAGAGARDDRRAGDRGHHRLHARRRHRPRGPRLVLELARGLLGHVRLAVRGHRARRGEGRVGPARRGDEEARGRRARRRRRTTSSSRRASRACGRTRRWRCRSWRSARSSTPTTRASRRTSTSR